jgi:hypothetical protein
MPIDFSRLEGLATTIGHERLRTRANQSRQTAAFYVLGLGSTRSARRTGAIHLMHLQVDKFLTKVFRTNADFVFTVTRDFVR